MPSLVFESTSHSFTPPPSSPPSFFFLPLFLLYLRSFLPRYSSYYRLRSDAWWKSIVFQLVSAGLAISMLSRLPLRDPLLNRAESQVKSSQASLLEGESGTERPPSSIAGIAVPRRSEDAPQASRGRIARWRHHEAELLQTVRTMADKQGHSRRLPLLSTSSCQHRSSWKA